MAYQNFFASRLYTDIGAGDTTITLEQAPTALTGRMVLEARNPTQREIISYTGVSGNQLTGVTRGIGGTSAKAHLKTALVEMNMTAEDLADLYAAFASFAPSGNGWLSSVATYTVASGYNKGNREYDITTSVDMTSLLSVGMRMKFTRGTAPPTQCTDLESSSSQFASRLSASLTGITFTDDFTTEAWVKPESYTAGQMHILGRYDGTNGFVMYMETTTGKLSMYCSGGGSNRAILGVQSVPIGRWTHVAVTVDMSAGAFVIYFDGVPVPFTMTGTALALTQAGDLRIGRDHAAGYFDGKIADARLWNTVRTQAQIRDNMNQVVAPGSAGLVGNWILNGNFNDAHANANHLTASGAATATDADNPMKLIEYGIIHKITSTTITLFTGTDHNIPFGVTLGSPQYSSADSPYGFPRSRAKWKVEAYAYNSAAFIHVNGTWYNPNSHRIVVPTGDFEIGYQCTQRVVVNANTSSYMSGLTQLSRNAAAAANSDEYELQGVLNMDFYAAPTIAIVGAASYHRIKDVSQAAATTWYLNWNANSGVAPYGSPSGGFTGAVQIFAVSSHV